MIFYFFLFFLFISFFFFFFFFFFQAEDGIRDLTVTGVQMCALPISGVAPEDEVLRPRHRCDRVELEKPQPAHRLENPARRAVQQLRAHGDAARSFLRYRSEERRVGKECRSRWSR